MSKCSKWNVDFPKYISSFSCREVCKMNLKTRYLIGKQDWWKPSFPHLQSQHQHNSSMMLIKKFSKYGRELFFYFIADQKLIETSRI